jgi:hypothetical protein
MALLCPAPLACRRGPKALCSVRTLTVFGSERRRFSPPSLGWTYWSLATFSCHCQMAITLLSISVPKGGRAGAGNGRLGKSSINIEGHDPMLVCDSRQVTLWVPLGHWPVGWEALPTPVLK